VTNDGGYHDGGYNIDLFLSVLVHDLDGLLMKGWILLLSICNGWVGYLIPRLFHIILLSPTLGFEEIVSNKALVLLAVPSRHFSRAVEVDPPLRCIGCGIVQLLSVGSRD
jgi:hypothetical protein